VTHIIVELVAWNKNPPLTWAYPI